MKVMSNNLAFTPLGNSEYNDKFYSCKLNHNDMNFYTIVEKENPTMRIVCSEAICDKYPYITCPANNERAIENAVRWLGNLVTDNQMMIEFANADLVSSCPDYCGMLNDTIMVLEDEESQKSHSIQTVIKSEPRKLNEETTAYNVEMEWHYICLDSENNVVEEVVYDEIDKAMDKLKAIQKEMTDGKGK